MGTFITGAVLFIIVAAIIGKMIKDKKDGKGGCGCGCEGCTHKCH